MSARLRRPIHAMGLKTLPDAYAVCRIDGMNIVFVNLLPFVLFSLFDGYIMPIVLGEKTGIASPYVLFVLSLVSVLPLVYYVGMGVACVSAQVG